MRVGDFKQINENYILDVLKCLRRITVKIKNYRFGCAFLVEICLQNWSKSGHDFVILYTEYTGISKNVWPFCWKISIFFLSITQIL